MQYQPQDETDLSGIDAAAGAAKEFIGKGAAWLLLFILMAASSAAIIAIGLPFAVAGYLDVVKLPMYYTPGELVAEPTMRIFAVFLGTAFTAVLMLKHTTLADVEDADL